MGKIDLSEIGFHNQNFWWYFFKAEFPNAYIEDEDLSIDEILEPYEPKDELEWVNAFTQYYDGVIDETDGYLDNPTTLETKISIDKVLKIEFHPGDTIYYINEVEKGCTGPHWSLQAFPYSEIKNITTHDNGIIHFLLILPLVYVSVDEFDEALLKMKEILPVLFSENICDKLAKCILYGLLKTDD